MAISKKSATAAGNDGTTATVSLTTSESPSATVSGDLVVILNGNNYYTLATMGTPTATGSPTMNAITAATGDAGSNQGHIKAWWYVANTSGAQSISVTETGSHDEEKWLGAYVLGGADTTTPVDIAGSTFNATQTTNNNAPTISPTTSNAFLIAASNSGSFASASSYTTGAPMTEDGEVHSGNISAVYASAQLSASGSTGTLAFTAASSAAYAACAIAIKTASGGGGPVIPPILIMQTRRPF